VPRSICPRFTLRRGKDAKRSAEAAKVIATQKGMDEPTERRFLSGEGRHGIAKGAAVCGVANTSLRNTQLWSIFSL
jgi:hypothetical protein